LLVAVFCVGLAEIGIAAGGQGNGQGNGKGGKQGNTEGNCTGICSSLLASQEEATYEGTVYNVGFSGQGIALDIGAEIVQIYGIGPSRYWEAVLDETRPAVGDVIRVTGKTLTFSDGSEKFVVFTVTFGTVDEDGNFVFDVEAFILRDEGGLPLWRGGGFGYSLRQHTRACPYLEDSGSEL
jgi:hypothetical protein